MNSVAALFGFILLYDSVAMGVGRKTITAEFRDLFETHPIQTSLGTAYILAHLHNYPKQFKFIDVFEGYALIFGVTGKRFRKKVD